MKIYISFNFFKCKIFFSNNHNRIRVFLSCFFQKLLHVSWYHYWFQKFCRLSPCFLELHLFPILWKVFGRSSNNEIFIKQKIIYHIFYYKYVYKDSICFIMWIFSSFCSSIFLLNFLNCIFQKKKQCLNFKLM